MPEPAVCQTPEEVLKAIASGGGQFLAAEANYSLSGEPFQVEAFSGVSIYLPAMTKVSQFYSELDFARIINGSRCCRLTNPKPGAMGILFIRRPGFHTWQLVMPKLGGLSWQNYVNAGRRLTLTASNLQALFQSLTHIH